MNSNQSVGQQNNVLTLAKGGSIAFVGRFLFMILGYLFTLLVARELGANEYGIFVLGFSVVNMAVSITLLGLNRGSVRFIAMYRGLKDRAREIGVFWVSLTISLICSFLGALVIFVFVDEISDLLNAPPEFPAHIWGFVSWIPILVAIYLLASIAEATKQIQYRTIYVDIGWPLLRVLLTAVALFTGWRLSGVIWANVLASAIILLLIGRSVYQIFVRGFETIKPIYETRQVLGFSIPVMLFNIISLTQNQLEIYFLTALKSTEAAGIFNVASRTAILSVAFLEGLGFIFSPLIADLTNRNQRDELQQLLSAVTRWSFTAGLSVFSLTWLLGHPLLRLFGETFTDAYGALVVLSLAQLLNAATGPVGLLITMSGRSHWNLINNLLTLGLNGLLNWLLIPPWGVLGAAIGSGLALTLVNLLRMSEVYIFMRIHAYDSQLLKPVIAAIVATLVTYFAIMAQNIGSDLVMIGGGIVLFLLFYIGCIVALGLNETDLFVLRAARHSAVNGWTRARLSRRRN